MVRVKMMSLLTVSVIVAVLATAGAVPALAQDPSYAGGDDPSYKDKCGCDKDKCGCDRDGRFDKERMEHGGMEKERMEYGGMHKEPKDVYMAVTSGGMTDTRASFSIDSIGVTGKDGVAAVFKFGSPLTGAYNASKDMGYISMENFLPATAALDKAGSVSMPTGNASAIIGLHGIKTLKKEKGHHVSEFRSVSVFLPDGTVKFIKLDEPVKVAYSKERKMVVIHAYPSFTKRMAEVFGGGAGATYGTMRTPSMTLADLMSAKSKATEENIGSEMPASAELPA